MVIKVYVAMISCSQEIKKNQQRAVMILESKNIPYTAIDITDPGNEEAKDYMVENAVPKEGAKIPVTPQIFNEADYCGDYDGLDMANECDTLGDFLKLTDDEKAGVKIGITGIGPKDPNAPQEENKLTNGVSASREASPEKKIIPNDVESLEPSSTVTEIQPDEALEKTAEPTTVTPESSAVTEAAPATPDAAISPPSENPDATSPSPAAPVPDTPEPAATPEPAPAAPAPAPTAPAPAPTAPAPAPTAPAPAQAAPAPATPKVPALPLDDDDETTSETFTTSDEAKKKEMEEETINKELQENKPEEIEETPIENEEEITLESNEEPEVKEIED